MGHAYAILMRARLRPRGMSGLESGRHAPKERSNGVAVGTTVAGLPPHTLAKIQMLPIASCALGKKCRYERACHRILFPLERRQSPTRCRTLRVAPPRQQPGWREFRP